MRISIRLMYLVWSKGGKESAHLLQNLLLPWHKLTQKLPGESKRLRLPDERSAKVSLAWTLGILAMVELYSGCKGEGALGMPIIVVDGLSLRDFVEDLKTCWHCNFLSKYL